MLWWSITFSSRWALESLCQVGFWGSHLCFSSSTVWASLKKKKKKLWSCSCAVYRYIFVFSPSVPGDCTRSSCAAIIRYISCFSCCGLDSLQLWAFPFSSNRLKREKQQQHPAGQAVIVHSQIFPQIKNRILLIHMSLPQIWLQWRAPPNIAEIV